MIVRGTTPTLTFTLPFEVSACEKVWVTFCQCGEELFTVDKGNCVLEGCDIKIALEQAQTLSLACRDRVQMQIRVVRDGVAMASEIINEHIYPILKEGEI